MNNVDITFQDYRKSNDIHGAVLYPATMIAPVQKKILKILFEQDQKINSIFDPFHGSGTALYEAFELRNSACIYGCDINPLANLITRVKLQGVSKNIRDNINILKNNLILEKGLDKAKEDNFCFHNMNKWFRSDILIKLKIIRSNIIKIKCSQDRLFFWMIFSNTVRKFSNTRSSTYKLHIKKSEDIENIKDNVIEHFISSILGYYSFFLNSSSNFQLFKENILDLIPNISNQKFDISISSPPYGDNATTVTYGQFSMLPLFFIDAKDLALEGWELNNYSIIDRCSMGGQKSQFYLDDSNVDLLKVILNKVSDSKKNKIINFFSDYFYFLSQLCRVTNKYIILTLGNRTVDGIHINLTNITKVFLERYEFENILMLSREIPHKRTPKILSKKNNKIISSMNEEYVIVHKRKSI